MTKRRLLVTACMLCSFATLLSVPAMASTAKADAVALSDEPNAILNSNDRTAVPNDLALNWTYGDDDIISYTFRPQHGDTVYYTVYSKVVDDNGTANEEKEKFAVKYIGDTAMFYEVKNSVVDTDTPFKVNSLNAYFKTLTAGDYSLTVSVPGDTAPATHTHWYDISAGNVSCGITYSAVALNVDLTVTAYDITANTGDSESNKPVKYSGLSTANSTVEVVYNEKPDNVPQIELTFNTGNGTLILEEGKDYELKSDAINVGPANLTIKGIGGFSGEFTVNNAYTISKGENTISDVYVVRWKYGEYDRNVNLFTADAKWGKSELYFSITTDIIDPLNPNAAAYVEGLEHFSLTDGMVSTQVEQYLNKLDAHTVYYLYATVAGCDNYFLAREHIQFDVVEVTNTWMTIPNVVSWEWHGFDENVNVINAVPAFGDSVTFSIYTKDGDDYTAIKFDGKDSFELENDGENGNKLPANVTKVLSDLDAGTYYLFASVISDTDNYSSINENFSADALVPFRVFKATNYWTQIPKIANWSYGSYNPEVNVISAASAHGSSDIRFRIYKQNGDGFGLLSFGGISSFKAGSIPAAVTDGLKALGVGKYYLRAEVAATNNYTGLQENVADFDDLPSFEVIKAENFWSTAPSITAWAEGKYSNDDNLPVAAAHYGVANIVIVDVNDEENIIYDSVNNINKLSEAKVGAYLLTATVVGTDNYSELTFNTIFRVFVPETATRGIAWWLVLIIVICSLGVLVFVFWLLHDKGVLQMLTSKTIVAMRTKATMDATIAAVRANKVSEEAKESIRLAEELERLEAEKAEIEEDDSDEEEEAILIERDEASGFATYVRYQRPFSVKLIQATDEAKDYYSRLKNVLLSYKKVKSKVSKGYDAFNKGRNQIAKLVIRGKTLCLYLALNPDHFADTKYKVERSESKKFAEVPCLFRIKNERRLGYAVDLIRVLCEELEIVKGELQDVDYRPPYESTEQLLEKGLIKKITYKKKIDNDQNESQSAAAETKAKVEDETNAQQEVAPAAPEENDGVKNAEEHTETAAATEQEAAATEDKQPVGQSNTDSGTGTKKHKKQQGAK